MKKIVQLGAAVAALVMAASAAGAQAGVLYSQAADGSGNAYSSQNDTTGGNGNFATVYDNFKLGAGAKITSVDFTGQYFNPPTPGTITAFTLSIYADNGGQPGAAVYSVNVAGNAGEVAGNIGGFPSGAYSIATNFNAAAGTTYWLSVVPDLGFPPQWGWAEGTGGDGMSYQDFLGSRTQLSADMAFTLNGGGVPEPATWGMLVLGVGMAGAALRRRREGMAVAA